MRTTIAALTLIGLFIGLQPIHAQNTDCGNGLPCGSIPWPQPNPPQLKSPTPIPTSTPRPDLSGDTGSGTATPIGGNLGGGDIGDQVATISGYQPTPVAVMNASMTPIGLSEQVDLIRQDTAVVFGYVRGLSNIHFGKMTILISFLLAAFTLVTFIKGWTILLPIVATVIGTFRKIVSFIMEFIPI